MSKKTKFKLLDINMRFPNSECVLYVDLDFYACLLLDKWIKKKLLSCLERLDERIVSSVFSLFRIIVGCIILSTYCTKMSICSMISRGNSAISSVWTKFWCPPSSVRHLEETILLQETILIHLLQLVVAVWHQATDQDRWALTWAWIHASTKKGNR